MHNDYRYSKLSSCACTRRQYEQQLNSLPIADCCLLTRTLTRGPDGWNGTFNAEGVFGLRLDSL